MHPFTTTNMASHMSEPPEPEALFDLAAMLVSSARGAPEEGAMTASLRLIDAAGRLAGLAITEAGRGDIRFWSSLQSAIRAGMTENYLDSESAYLRFLDSIVDMVADEARIRNGLGPHGC
ncbi:MAG: DUF6092 family protein [Candidatus Dormibacteraceae bacterium]